MKFVLIFILMFCFKGIELSQNTFTADRIVASSRQSDSLFAKIITEKNRGSINIKAIFYNFTDSSFYLYYEMESEKKSNSGSSKSKQSGRFYSSPDSESIMAEVGLDVDESANYEIILRVFDKGKLISTDSLSLISNQ